MTQIIKLALIFILISLTACSGSHDVASKGTFQKRKHLKGYHVNNRFAQLKKPNKTIKKPEIKKNITEEEKTEYTRPIVTESLIDSFITREDIKEESIKLLAEKDTNRVISLGSKTWTFLENTLPKKLNERDNYRANRLILKYQKKLLADKSEGEKYVRYGLLSFLFLFGGTIIGLIGAIILFVLILATLFGFDPVFEDNIPLALLSILLIIIGGLLVALSPILAILGIIQATKNKENRKSKPELFFAVATLVLWALGSVAGFVLQFF